MLNWETTVHGVTGEKNAYHPFLELGRTRLPRTTITPVPSFKYAENPFQTKGYRRTHCA